MMRALVLIAFVGFAATACKKDPPPPPKNEFEAFERRYVVEYQTLAMAMRKRGEAVDEKDVPKNYRAVYIGPPGVFIDRKLVATLAELKSKRTELLAAIETNRKLLPTIGYTGLTVAFELDQEPAEVALDALRLFETPPSESGLRPRPEDLPYFMVARQDPDIPAKATRILCSPSTLSTKPDHDPDPETVQLSILLDPKSIWIGLSRVNEFQEIPDKADGRDFEKLSTTLREHKASAFFEQRTDIELAATAGTAADVLMTFDTFCNVGFIDISLLTADQLAARPQL